MASFPVLSPTVRPAASSAGVSMPSATPVLASRRACAVNECPVRAVSTVVAAYANALPSETQPGEAGVGTSGVHAVPRIHRPPERTYVLAPTRLLTPATSGSCPVNERNRIIEIGRGAWYGRFAAHADTAASLSAPFSVR